MEPILVSHEEAVKLVASMYLGEQCKFCGRKYKTLEDLQDTVFAGYHEHGRLACSTCWDENTSGQAPTMQEEKV